MHYDYKMAIPYLDHSISLYLQRFYRLLIVDPHSSFNDAENNKNKRREKEIPSLRYGYYNRGFADFWRFSESLAHIIVFNLPARFSTHLPPRISHEIIICTIAISIIQLAHCKYNTHAAVEPNMDDSILACLSLSTSNMTLIYFVLPMPFLFIA